MAKYHDWLDEDKLLLISGWARSGLSEEQIAKNMGIALSTFKVWKNKHMAISTALKKGKEVVDFEVENALYKRAVGFSYDEITKEPIYDLITGEQIKDDQGKPVIATTKIVTKTVAPDTAAAFIWLKNRKPDKWRDTPSEVESNERVTIVDDL